METPNQDTNRLASDTPRQPRAQFSIRQIMVITVILAVASAGIGQLFRAAQGSVEDIGPFIILTAMAPLGVMVAVNWLFRLIGKL